MLTTCPLSIVAASFSFTTAVFAIGLATGWLLNLFLFSSHHSDRRDNDER